MSNCNFFLFVCLIICKLLVGSDWLGAVCCCRWATQWPIRTVTTWGMWITFTTTPWSATKRTRSPRRRAASHDLIPPSPTIASTCSTTTRRSSSATSTSTPSTHPFASQTPPTPPPSGRRPSRNCSTRYYSVTNSCYSIPSHLYNFQFCKPRMAPFPKPTLWNLAR